MKLIPITKGQFAIVDDADYDWLMQWKWQAYWSKTSKTYYAIRSKLIGNWRDKKNATIRMHRLILGVTNPNIYVDHLDHNGLNCQRSNIREATLSQSSCNRRSLKKGQSIYKGVTSMGATGKWRTQIQVNGKKVCRSQHDTEIEAAHTYDTAAKQFHGEFANLNFK